MRVRRFRNIRDAYIEPGPDVCVLYGDNAQGKTNFLEALFVLSNLQSFRTHRLRDLLPFHGGFSHLEAEVERQFGIDRLDLVLSREGKQSRVNGKVPGTTSAYLGVLPTVVFSPQDLVLAKGSQDLRRRYIDRATFISDPAYLHSLRNYNRSLRHRNAALRKHTTQLKVWNKQVAIYGAAVLVSRRQTLEHLAVQIGLVHSVLGDSKEKIEFEFRPEYSELDVEDMLLERLTECEDRDRKAGYTTVGPHRDQLRIRLSGRNVEEHSSQGQSRTLALAMKLALLQWGKQQRGEEPLFLLDDPGSELDRERLSALGCFLASWRGQVLITGTTKDAVPLPPSIHPHFYCVADGEFFAD